MCLMQPRACSTIFSFFSFNFNNKAKKAKGFSMPYAPSMHGFYKEFQSYP